MSSNRTGLSSANTQEIDSLMIVTPNDIVLSRFRSRLFSSNGQNDVDLGGPLSFDADLAVSIPPGYTCVDTSGRRLWQGLQVLLRPRQPIGC